MTHIIKFRCWDVENKKMYPVAFPTWNGSIETRDGDYTHPTFYLSGGGPEMQGILMQFTGLSDCIDQQIFEGDIIQYTSFTTNDLNIAIIEFRDYGYSLKGIKNDKFVNLSELKFDLLDDKTFLQLGNIYENPELLK